MVQCLAKINILNHYDNILFWFLLPAASVCLRSENIGYIYIYIDNIFVLLETTFLSIIRFQNEI